MQILLMIEEILGPDGLDRLSEYLTSKRSERARTRRFLLQLIRQIPVEAR
jgi:hypothetical protein